MEPNHVAPAMRSEVTSLLNESMTIISTLNDLVYMRDSSTVPAAYIQQNKKVKNKTSLTNSKNAGTSVSCNPNFGAVTVGKKGTASTWEFFRFVVQSPEGPPPKKDRFTWTSWCWYYSTVSFTVSINRKWIADRHRVTHRSGTSIHSRVNSLL